MALSHIYSDSVKFLLGPAFLIVLLLSKRNSLSLTCDMSKLSNTFQYEENNALYMKKYAFTALFFLSVLLLHPTYSHAQTVELPDSISEQNLNSTELLARGDELLDAGSYEEAIIYYDAALAIDPSNLLALFNKALALDNLEEFDEAISYYNRVLVIDPTDIDALYNKGLALDNLGKPDEAISYYDAVLEIDPTDIDALYNKGLALDNLGKPDEAISYYNKVLALDPNDVDALYYKGFALDRLGKYSEAITYYDRVLAINPNDTDALNNKNIAVGKQDVNGVINIQPVINGIINIQPDETLLVIVGVFVSLLIIIIIINLVANKRQGKTDAKTLAQTPPSMKSQHEEIEKEKKSDDERWKYI